MKNFVIRNKTIIILLFFVFVNLSLPRICEAQYQLKPAFPNLPNFSDPVELVHADDGTNRLFVVQQKGIIYVFNNSPTVNTRKIFIDLSSRVLQTSVSGLFGLAFHPDFENNRYFYVHYVSGSVGNAYTGIAYIKISRFTASSTNPDSALINTELNLLTVPEPHIVHNGGKVAFGPDGYLYTALGDGFITPDSAQNKANLLGKVLRINVDSTSGGRNYSIPPTNPYYENTQGYKEEIYALGFRNPWKFSFDVPTNRLWLGDVGHDLFEEIDVVENGKNYGWPFMEGFHCYPDTNVCDTTGMDFTRPIWEYSLCCNGMSITGGFVYRGTLFPDLYGKYIYGDFVEGKIWSLLYDGINPIINVQLLDTNFSIVSFGEDQNNELYVCNYYESPGVGRIYKFVTTRILNLTAFIEGFYNPVLNIMRSDTIKVYLRNNSFPYTIIDSTKGILNNQGRGVFTFNNIQNNQICRIVVKHRNSIETWSKEVVFQNDTLNYDFTTSSSQAHGNNLVLKGSKYCIYSGDVNQDGIIDAGDLSIADNNVYYTISGYVASDVNGDSIVDATDLSIIDNNVFKSIIMIRP